MISINDEIVLLNLDTNEEEKYKIVQFTQVYEPSAMVGAYATDAPYRRIVTSSGGTMDEKGFLLVSTASKIGKASIGKNLGDEITYEIGSGVSARFKVLAIGEKRFKNNIGEQNFLYSDVYSGDEGLSLYKQLISLGEFPVIARPSWSKHFCFVVEDIVYGRHGEKIFVGTTFNNGVIYQRNKEYDSSYIFSKYNGEYKTKIESQYKHVTKIVLKSDAEPFDYGEQDNGPRGAKVSFIKSSGEVIEYTDDMKEQLRIKLKQFRSEKARELRFPAYCIFKNKTLEDIVEKLPTDADLFEALCGEWMITREKYGKSITEIVKDFLNSYSIIKVNYR